MSVGAVISAIARGDARMPSSKYRLALREILARCAVAVQLGCSRPSPHFTGFDRDLSTVVVAALAAITALGAVCVRSSRWRCEWATSTRRRSRRPPLLGFAIVALGPAQFLADEQIRGVATHQPALAGGSP